MGANTHKLNFFNASLMQSYKQTPDFNTIEDSIGRWI